MSFAQPSRKVLSPLRMVAVDNNNFSNITVRIAIAAICLLSLGLLIGLSFFGSGLTDESFPIAIAVRFLEGQKPFIDDFTPYIGLGLLLTPFVKLSLLIHHGRDELILFLRHSYLAVLVLFSTYTFYITKKYLPSLLAFFISMMLLWFHPFGINDLHYDTLGMLFWSVIILQFFNFVFRHDNSALDYFIFSFVSLLLCLTYPTFVVLLVALYIFGYFYLTNRKFFLISHFSMFFITALLLSWLLFGYFDVKLIDIKNTLKFSHDLYLFSAVKQSMILKVLTGLREIISNYTPCFLVMTGLVGAAYYQKNNKLTMFALLSAVYIVPLFFINLTHAAFTEIFFVLNSFGFIAGVIFIVFLRSNELAKRLFKFIWVPAFIAGVVTSSSSATHSLVFIIGFFPAVLLSFVFSYFVFLQENLNKISDIFSRGILICGLSLTAVFQLSYIYGESDFGRSLYGNTVVYEVSGPLKNLHLQKKRADILEKLQNDISLIDNDANKFIYFGPFSFGYLLVSNLKPGEYMLYCPYEFYHFNGKVRTPNYVIDLRRFYELPGPIEPYLIGASYKKIRATSFYDFYLGL